MATWTYADYITLEGSAKLARLRLHIQEVSQAIANADVSAHGYQASRGTQMQYLAGLKSEEKTLSGAVGGRVRFARMGR